jgi:hypothetical protein
MEVKRRPGTASSRQLYTMAEHLTQMLTLGNVKVAAELRRGHDA